jgi:U3 small nucleolar RNA-associated protein MPP10
MPSIAMEDVQPVSVSEAAMLAPEEIKEKKHDELKGAAEKTDSDKLRLRKRKKAVKRLKQRERDRKQAELASRAGNSTKAKKAAMDKAARDVIRDSATGKVTLATVSFVVCLATYHVNTSANRCFEQFCAVHLIRIKFCLIYRG